MVFGLRGTSWSCIHLAFCQQDPALMVTHSPNKFILGFDETILEGCEKRDCFLQLIIQEDQAFGMRLESCFCRKKSCPQSPRYLFFGVRLWSVLFVGIMASGSTSVSSGSIKA